MNDWDQRVKQTLDRKKQAISAQRAEEWKNDEEERVRRQNESQRKQTIVATVKGNPSYQAALMFIQSERFGFAMKSLYLAQPQRIRLQYQASMYMRGANLQPRLTATEDFVPSGDTYSVVITLSYPLLIGCQWKARSDKWLKYNGIFSYQACLQSSASDVDSIYTARWHINLNNILNPKTWQYPYYGEVLLESEDEVLNYLVEVYLKVKGTVS